LICPNYNLFNFSENKICEKCKANNYFQCTKNKCIQNSRFKSLLGTLEMYWQRLFFPYHKLVNKFIAPSQFMKDKLLEFNFPNSNIEVLYNFNNQEMNFSTSDTKDYFLYFGRLSTEKGLKEFIQTLSKLKKDFLFYIAGQGPAEKDLKKLVKELSLENKVKFLGYFSSDRKQELEEIIQQAKFIVVPSIWYENCSLSIVESLARGKFVLASNLGGNSELINKENGCLYNLNNEADLLDKISILIDNKGSNLEIKIKTLEKFDSEKYYQKLIKIYQDLV